MPAGTTSLHVHDIRLICNESDLQHLLQHLRQSGIMRRAQGQAGVSWRHLAVLHLMVVGVLVVLRWWAGGQHGRRHGVGMVGVVVWWRKGRVVGGWGKERVVWRWREGCRQRQVLLGLGRE